MIREAVFSECGKYRYHLFRQWDGGKPTAMCIGLNPSTANGIKDDHTIRILIKTLTALGFGGFYMCNLYALITSKPEKLSECPDPVAENAKYIDTIAATCSSIIFCWGTFKQAYFRGKLMKQKFPNAQCFGKNKDGSPFHPRALHYAGISPENTSIIKF